MAFRMKLFMKIFKAELEDLSEDLLSVEKKYKEKLESQEIGNFVYQENEAFLIHEGEGILLIREMIDSLDTSKFDSVEMLIETIRKDIHELRLKHKYPEGVESLIKRKINKVKSYIESWPVQN